MTGPEVVAAGRRVAAGSEVEARPEAMAQTRAAYGRRAAEYTAQLGSISATDVSDRRLIADWAEQCAGPLADLGCGPGHWTGFLASRGLQVLGIEPVAAFRARAAQAHPNLRFLPGDAHHLGLPTGILGGVLAWYSLIHLPPAELPGALAEIARALSPDGRLLLGFFTGPRLERFDHAVTPAWFWPMPELIAQLRTAGFGIEAAVQRTDPGARPHGAISAQLI